MTLHYDLNAMVNKNQIDNSNERDRSEKYRYLIKILEKRCEQMSKSNEKIAARSLTVKKLIKKRSKDVELLKSRLDSYNDNWRS
ncbi:CLUMA_CG018812, isoform A [Clunio marinus]|uniref:CLUMA_CG018812, isoform A n=1 Tax=Clunio marinus TaxID=568069 RepID=A0A1J1J0C3_9DIPT|nr:CLUMA_CG018812, isoform A [Clunio marinus]